MEYLEAIQDAIEKGYGIRAMHVKTVPVHLKHEGQTMWEGEVEVFTPNPQDKAPKAIYAWGFEKIKGKMEFVTVLEEPPVKDAETAVKAYLVSQFKKP